MMDVEPTDETVTTRVISKLDSRRKAVLGTIITALGLFLTSIPVVRYAVTPWLISTVQTAMAADMDARADAKIAPLTGAFKAIIESRIRQLEQEIAALEYRRDKMPASTWNGMDVQVLVSKQQELFSQRNALAAISTGVRK